jgi:hypothetical protein
LVLAGGGFGGPGFLGAGLLAGFGAPGLFGGGLDGLLDFGFDDEGRGCFPPAGVFGFGVVVVGVVCPPPPLPPDPDPDPDWDGVVVVVVGVVVVVPLLCDGQDSCTLFAGPGRFSEDTGAPGGSWKVRTWPVSSVTVTVQSAAEALGSAATADTARTVPADAMATLSFRRVNTVVLSPPAAPLTATARTPSRRRTPGPSY